MSSKCLAIAKMLDHALLSPTLRREDLEAGLRFALEYQVATVCIVPFYVARAAEVLGSSDVLVSTVVGYPHGSHATSTKIAETRSALDDGAREIDFVVNINLVLSEEFALVKSEVLALTELCHEADARIKMIFENCYLQDSHKVRLCELAGECGVDWVKTSTGVGPFGATIADVTLMRRHSPASVQIKASGGVRDLDSVLRMSEFVTRCGTSSSRRILDECRSRYAERG